MTLVSTALLLTLPGIPCIYTGDEVGAEYSPYVSRGPIGWNEQVSGLRDYHKKLIALRKELPSLHSRSWIPLTLEPAQDQVAYGYLRYHGEHEDPILLLLNFTEAPTQLAFSMPEGFSNLSGASLQDLLSEERVAVRTENGLKKVSVPGYGVRILTAA